MATFRPCQGKTACRDNGTRCLTCGRTLEEITDLRSALDQLANLVLEYDYRNVDEFAAYVARKLTKTITYRRQELEPSEFETQN
jgi:predicted Fe-S protein YdhL (DUF1289 family)